MPDIAPQRITDKDERARALEAASSFIVQAPAGSGKTELLTQRYLRLLGQVQNPEEILAVTFTRKAAAEMRNRIVSAMYPPPGAEDNRLPVTKELATRALERDRECGWQLANYPARLRIRTLDSVNAWLASCCEAPQSFTSTMVPKTNSSALCSSSRLQALKRTRQTRVGTRKPQIKSGPERLLQPRSILL